MGQDDNLQQRFEAQASQLRIHQAELEAQNEELRQTNLELELLHQQYVDLFEFAPVGYVVCDLDGTIQQINALGCRQLGFPHAYLMGRLFALFVDPVQRPQVAALLREVLTSTEATHRTELQMLRPDGSRWDAQWECTPLQTPSGWVARTMLTDITALKTAQREAEERTQEAQRLGEELQTFFRAMTQDLTGPQRQIQGFAQLLAQSLTSLDPQSDPKSAKILKHLLQAASDLGALTTSLTEFFQSTQPNSHRRLVSLNLLVTNLFLELRPQQPSRNVVMTHDPLPSLLINQHQLKLMLSHLLSNALKFTAPRAEAQIHVGVQESEEDYLLSVRDNGVGFDPTQSQRLFTVFGRLHRNADFKGQGLGLALVKRLVQQLGGQVWAESVPGEGAVFWLRLPKRMVSAPATLVAERPATWLNGANLPNTETTGS